MSSENEVKGVLRRLGVNTSSCGYSYIPYGIVLMLEDKEYLEYITKRLYVEIARRFHTSVACVERDIRSTVETIWRNQDNEALLELCGDVPAAKRPSNKRFLEMMYDYFIKISGSGGGHSLSECHDGFVCERLGETCPYGRILYEEAEKLREERMQLKFMLQREEMLQP